MNPYSFSDDASTRPLGVRRHRPRISAQVPADLDLSWIHDLKTLVSAEAEELSGDQVWETIETRPDWLRRLVFNGIFRVRIHIIDPQGFELEAEDMLRRVNRDLTIASLDAMARRQPRDQQSDAAKQLLGFVDGYIRRRADAHSLARVTAQRLKELASITSVSAYEVLGEESRNTGDSPNEEPLTAMRSEVTRSIAVAAKTATLFSPALDAVDESLEEIGDLWYGSRIAADRSRQLVSREYAFDIGDARATREADEQRAAFLAEIGLIFPSRMSGPLGRLWEVESRTSLEVQAADLAVGWARRTLERHSLGHVTSFFEYVTFNGQRVTRASLSSVLGRAGILLMP